MTPNRTVARSIASVVAAAITVAACGGDEPRELAGFQREPAPVVAEYELPDLLNDGEPMALRAEPGELLVIYFGYTNCPDFCPTTMADVRAARMQMDEPERVSVAMITVDPDRDLPILADYVSGFFPDDGHALGTDDPSLLARVAAPFGAQYEVVTNADGEVEVGHRTDLYAVDDQGRIVLTWSFGVTKDDLAADFEALLEGTSA